MTEADDLRARLANVTALRDEMRTAGGAVIWIDDLDEILDNPRPGVALEPEWASFAASICRIALLSMETDPRGERPEVITSARALLERLEGTL